MRWCTCTCVVVFIYLWFFLLQTSASRSAARHSQLKVVFVCTRRTVLERRRCHVGCCGAVVKGCYRVEVTAIRIRVREVGFGGASDGASEMLTRDGTPLPRLHLFRAGRIVHPVRTWGCGAVGGGVHGPRCTSRPTYSPHPLHPPFTPPPSLPLICHQPAVTSSTATVWSFCLVFSTAPCALALQNTLTPPPHPVSCPVCHRRRQTISAGRANPVSTG